MTWMPDRHVDRAALSLATDFSFQPISLTVTDDAAAPPPEPLRLDHFLKLVGACDTGGQAKLVIQGGEVRVNGETDTRRRRKLRPGDIVEFAGHRHTVTDAHL